MAWKSGIGSRLRHGRHEAAAGPSGQVTFGSYRCTHPHRRFAFPTSPEALFVQRGPSPFDRRHRGLVPALVGAVGLLIGSSLPLSAPAHALASPASKIVVIDSLSDPAALTVLSGAASLTRLVSPTGEVGIGVGDIATPDRLTLGPARGPAEIAGLPLSLQIDVLGSSNWRPMYLEVQDATGEIFHYWVGHFATETWQTIRVDLTAKPASTTWGDGDGILDLPVSFHRIIVDPQPAAATGVASFAVRNLRIEVEAWTALTLRPKTFVPSNGETGSISMTLVDPASFVAVLTDELGQVRTLRGSAAAAVPFVVKWNGRDDGGRVMQGSIRARLAIGPPEARRTVDIPYFGGLLRQTAVDQTSVVGMNTFFSEPNPSRRAFVEWQARRLEEARVAQIRETFVWNRLEPRRGWFEWAKFDQAVEIAQAHGIGMVGVLAFSADWASTAPLDLPQSQRELYAPNTSDFAAYVTAVVKRYGSRVHEWEIWNEPNHPKFWFPHPNPEAYATLLHAASAAIRSVDPHATIVLGGIVGTDVAYLDRLRAAGAWPDFDVLAIHGYVRLSPEASGLGGWFDRAVAYVQRYGAKPVWLTEICWPVSAAEPGIPAITTAAQAAYLGRTFTRAAEAGVARVFWYNVIDHPSAAGSRYDACGLFDAKQQARPAFNALKTIGAAFEGSVTMGTFDPAATSRAVVDIGSTRWTASSRGSVSRSANLVKASYAFASKSDEIPYSTSLRLPGTPTSITANVTGDGSANSMMVRFVDATGETCMASFAPLRLGTRLIRMPLDGTAANWSCWGGDHDRVLDAPVTFKGVSVYPTGIGPMSGSFRISDLRVGKGPVDTGLVLAHGTTLRFLVKRAASWTSTVSTIAVPSASAIELRDGQRRALTVSSGTLRLGVGPQLRVVEIPLAMTQTAISPGTWTWFRWISGDSTLGRPQILRPDGTWLRTTPAMLYPAGPRSMAWNGRVIGASGTSVPAPAGTYMLRLVVTAPDGRTGTLRASLIVR
jgi:hypothetical protein